MKEGKGFLANFKKIGGMDLWMYAVCAVLVGATVTTGAMSNDLMAYIAICLAVSSLTAPTVSNVSSFTPRRDFFASLE